jgi:hypothetical protein
MLTKYGKDADSVASGVISIENGLDFTNTTLQDEHAECDEMKGTLILAGDEDDDSEENSQL